MVYNLDTNKIKYILHLDQKASQADIYKRGEIQAKKHNLQDASKSMNPNIMQNTSRRHRLLAHHLHIYKERVSLDTQ